MSPADSRDSHTREILARVETGEAISQRSLSRDLGIALGLTNLLLRRLVAKGWIRIVRVRPNQIRYLLTPAGMSQKARMSRAYFRDSLRFYAEARNRIQDRFTDMLNQTNDSGARCRDVVFCGAGETAEVGYVCLQRTGLRLVGVVDDERAGRDFFGLTVRPASGLTAAHLDGVPYDRVVIMSLDDQDTPLWLSASGIPEERIFFL